MHWKQWLAIGSSILLGVTFVTAGLGKLPEPTEASAIILALSKLSPPTLVRTVILWLPNIELALGLLLIVGIATKFMASFSSVLIATFIFSNSWLISQGLGEESCGCFETFEYLPLGQLSVLEAIYIDIGMLALVLVILFCHPSNFLAIRPWFYRERVTLK